MGQNTDQGLRGDRMLVLVDGTKNSNKRYDMVVNGDGTFTAYWGRIKDDAGHPSQHMRYPMSKYDSMLRSKLRKGYRDVTAYNAAFTASNGEGESLQQRQLDLIDDESVRGIIKVLLGFADAKVASTYKIGAESVTDEAVVAAKRQLDRMRASKTVADFNRELTELLVIIPRRITVVDTALAHSRQDFGKILTRESDLLDVLDGQRRIAKRNAKRDAGGRATGGDAEEVVSMLDVLGIRMFSATDKQRQHVMRHLGESLQDKVNGIYRVQNLATEERFDKWLAEHGNPRVREFWHGSRNENWISILQNGLVLNPNAQLTGKMFGSGSYFAPSPSKSFNYTSYRGTYWAHGSSDMGVMGLYAVAYGKPYVVYDNHEFGYSFGYDDLRRLDPKADCVHAKKGKVLRNDEVIFYREEQTTINYLVDFK